MRLLLASIVVTLVATAGCAGQIITVGPKDDRDSGGEGDDGGPVEDAIVVDTYAPPFDAEPPPYDAPIIVGDTGSCLVGQEPCISGDQCCSGICEGTCQDMLPPPGCLPDGYSCDGTEPCCSGPCFNGVCGATVVDSGPPVSCSVPANNACFECLAGPCCPQLADCEGDTECTQMLACFEGCFASGNGLTCEQKCAQAYPSPFEAPLTSCAENACLQQCQ